MKKSWCDTCPKPGNCCKRLFLSFGEDGEHFKKGEAPVFWKDEGITPVQAWLDERKMPFSPLEIAETFKNEAGREYDSYWFSCTKLGADGRCTIYDNRPELCRSFKPGESGLCVFTKNHKVRAVHREGK